MAVAVVLQLLLALLLLVTPLHPLVQPPLLRQLPRWRPPVRRLPLIARVQDLLKLFIFLFYTMHRNEQSFLRLQLHSMATLLAPSPPTYSPFCFSARRSDTHNKTLDSKGVRCARLDVLHFLSYM